MRMTTQFLWSVAGGLLLVFVFFAGLGAFDPAEALGVTFVFAGLAVVWFVHAWPHLRGR